MARPTAEQIFRGMLRGPLTTKANSSPNQWAGITALASGDATVTVSTTNVKSNSIILYGVRSGGNSSQAIDVKSIVDSSYFTLGTANGSSIDQAADIHWVVYRQD